MIPPDEEDFVREARDVLHGVISQLDERRADAIGATALVDLSATLRHAFTLGKTRLRSVSRPAMRILRRLVIAYLRELGWYAHEATTDMDSIKFSNEPITLVDWLFR
jgi:hypothetical protein